MHAVTKYEKHTHNFTIHSVQASKVCEVEYILNSKVLFKLVLTGKSVIFFYPTCTLIGQDSIVADGYI